MTDAMGLMLLDRATQMLAEVKTIDDAKGLMDMAAAAKVWAQKHKLGREAVGHAHEIEISAEIKLGELLMAMPKHPGGNPNQAVEQATGNDCEPVACEPARLEDLGISKSLSAESQALAKLPESIKEDVKSGKKSKSKAIKSEARRQDLEAQKAVIEGGAIESVDGHFEVIVVDPPWPYGTKYDPDGRRAANPYPEMSLDEIAAIELPASEDCVLWLWTTHKFMRHSFKILDAWGFRDVAILTWVKDRMGLGSWLRSQSEFCIMAVKGNPKVTLTNQTTVIHGPLREHSRKPDEFYQLVESLCIGRRLDYFSRQHRLGWQTFGNDTAKFCESSA